MTNQISDYLKTHPAYALKMAKMKSKMMKEAKKQKEKRVQTLRTNGRR